MLLFKPVSIRFVPQQLQSCEQVDQTNDWMLNSPVSKARNICSPYDLPWLQKSRGAKLDFCSILISPANRKLSYPVSHARSMFNFVSIENYGTKYSFSTGNIRDISVEIWRVITMSESSIQNNEQLITTLNQNITQARLILHLRCFLWKALVHPKDIARLRCCFELLPGFWLDNLRTFSLRKINCSTQHLLGGHWPWA